MKASGCVEPWQPPVPPHCCGLGAQSTSCCGASVRSGPPAIASADSTVSVAENAQHEPHASWFLTGVTIFVVRQSTAAGRSDGAAAREA